MRNLKSLILPLFQKAPSFVTVLLLVIDEYVRASELLAIFRESPTLENYVQYNRPK